MNVGLYSSVEALGVAERRLESITANLAHLGTTGYKRVEAVAERFETHLRAQEDALTTRRSVDWSQGLLVHSDRALDIALEGPGLLAVESASGEAYTRAGRLRIDGLGRLSTLDGAPVAWEGPRGDLVPHGHEPRIDRLGEVWQDGRRVGRLRIVEFADRGALRRGADGLFHTPASVLPAEGGPVNTFVHQNKREASNATAAGELTDLILTQRRFESGTRLMSLIEESYRRLTSSRA